MPTPYLFKLSMERNIIAIAMKIVWIFSVVIVFMNNALIFNG
jgi:hypothetical protein